MRTLQEHIKEQLQNPEVAKEYEALGEEYEVIRQIIRARISAGLTQKDLAKRLGTQQSNVSRIENGNSNPSISFLKRIADATGTKLHIDFIEKKELQTI
ncbi:helix-turn-helix domain-containing protein [Candidatus Latescibacterota bacterium]